MSAVRPALHRIAALAAVLAPARAERLLSMVAGPEGVEAALAASELARRSRHERLAALERLLRDVSARHRPCVVRHPPDHPSTTEARAGTPRERSARP